MDIDINLILSIISGLVAIGGIVLKYQAANSRTQYMLTVSRAFHKVVEQLSSEKESDQLAGSVLLRRFFDTNSELGTGLPFANDAINVISALLRSKELELDDRKVLRKTLADSLAYAPSLKYVDLQQTNLREAFFGKVVRGSYAQKVVLEKRYTVKNFFSYFSKREEVNVSKVHNSKVEKRKEGKSKVFVCMVDKRTCKRNELNRDKLNERCVYRRLMDKSYKRQAVNLENADFFEANLSGANFEYAKMKNAILYETVCEKTVFKNADLRNANFMNAKLQRANFKVAVLRNANFTGAKLQNANFTDADLRNANFTDAELEGAIWNDADTEGAIFDNPPPNFLSSLLRDNTENPIICVRK